MIWRFTLTNSNEGNLVLSDEPIGWADIVMNAKRDMKWHGVFFEYAVNLKFYGTGYAYIKNIYDTYGIDEYVGILVEVKCSETDSFEDFYNGKLVIGKCEFENTDVCLVDTAIEIGGCFMQFSNRIDQKVDLNKNEDFSGGSLPDYTGLPFEIILEPKTIIQRDVGDPETSNMIEVEEIRDITSGTGIITLSSNHLVQLPVGNVSIGELGMLFEVDNFFGTIFSDILPFGLVPLTGVYNFKYEYNVVGHVRAQTDPTLLAYCGEDGTTFHNMKVDLLLYKNGFPQISNNIVNLVIDCNGGEYKNFSGTVSVDQDLSLALGDEIKMFLAIDASGDYHRQLLLTPQVKFTTQVTSFDGNITIKATIDHPETPCQVYLINEALSRTVEAITDDCMRVKSDYFGRTDSQPYESDEDGCGSLEVITKGLLIRQFPLDGLVFSVSFQDLFNGLNPIHNLGFGMELDSERPGFDVIRVEPMEYFYDSAILMSCDNVPALKRKVVMEYFPSNLQFGYEKWEAENTMGLDEIATKREYRTTLSEAKATFNFLSKFVASGYSIEVTRNIEYSGDATKDWRYDQDVFIICIQRDVDAASGYSVEQGRDCTIPANVTDVLNPESIYNYRISPIRNFMRWVKAYMQTYFSDINAVNAKFVFTNGDGNFLAKGEIINGCIIEDEAIGENEDIAVDDFNVPTEANPIFKNEFVTFDYPVSFAEQTAIRSNPRGTIRFRSRSTDAWESGYIYQLQYRPNDGIATFTLLPKY